WSGGAGAAGRWRAVDRAAARRSCSDRRLGNSRGRNAERAPARGGSAFSSEQRAHGRDAAGRSLAADCVRARGRPRAALLVRAGRVPRRRISAGTVEPLAAAHARVAAPRRWVVDTLVVRARARRRLAVRDRLARALDGSGGAVAFQLRAGAARAA